MQCSLFISHFCPVLLNDSENAETSFNGVKPLKYTQTDFELIYLSLSIFEHEQEKRPQLCNIRVRNNVLWRCDIIYRRTINTDILALAEWVRVKIGVSWKCLSLRKKNDFQLLQCFDIFKCTQWIERHWIRNFKHRKIVWKSQSQYKITKQLKSFNNNKHMSNNDQEIAMQ